MDRVRSPLLIPAERGVVFRIVLAVLILALSLIGAETVFEGIRSGTIMWPSRYSPHVRVSQSFRPEAFWIAVVLWLAMSIWLFYASVKEIFYALRLPKRR